MKHTKEPWSAHAFTNMWDGHYKTEIRSIGWEAIASIRARDREETATADAQRIVECVNALAGVADPANAIAAAKEALLAAAQDLVASHIVDNVLQERKGQKPFPEPASLAKVRAALALLKGVQP